MSLRRAFAVARKELRHITRDPRTLFLVTVSPALMLFTFAYVFSFDVDHANLAVMDMDRSQASRDYIRGMFSSDALSMVAWADDYDAIDHLLMTGEVGAALVIPPGFGEALGRRPPAQVQVVVDGSDTIAARQMIGMIATASQDVAVEIQPVAHEFSPPFDLRLPIGLRTVSIFSPIRHYMTILRTIMLKGANLTTLWPEALALAALGIGTAFLSMRNVARVFD